MVMTIPQTNLLGVDVLDCLRIAGDPEALQGAYTRVFASVEGRAVLLDLMARSHMLDRRPASMTLAERAQMDGMASFMLELLDLAGVGQHERAAALLIATAPPDMERAHDDANGPEHTPDTPDAGWDTTGDDFYPVDR